MRAKIRYSHCNGFKEGLIELVDKCHETPFFKGNDSNKVQLTTAGDIAYHLLCNGYWIYDNESIETIQRSQKGFIELPAYPRINEMQDECINLMFFLPSDLRAIKNCPIGKSLLEESLGLFLSGKKLFPQEYLPPNWILLSPSSCSFRPFFKGLTLLHEGVHWFADTHNLYSEIMDESIEKKVNEIYTEHFIIDCLYQYGGPDYQQTVEEMAIKAVNKMTGSSFQKYPLDKELIVKMVVDFFGPPISLKEERRLCYYVNNQVLIRAFQIAPYLENRREYICNRYIAIKKGFLEFEAVKRDEKTIFEYYPTTPLLKWLKN